MKNTIADALPTFTSIRSMIISGRGILFTTQLDRNTKNFKYLINQLVTIDGTIYTCIDANMAAEAGYGPWTKGEEIGLLVREV